LFASSMEMLLHSALENAHDNKSVDSMTKLGNIVRLLKNLPDELSIISSCIRYFNYDSMRYLITI
jgi:hypothetical protein